MCDEETPTSLSGAALRGLLHSALDPPEHDHASGTSMGQLDNDFDCMAAGAEASYSNPQYPSQHAPPKSISHNYVANPVAEETDKRVSTHLIEFGMHDLPA
jgi:hypothetical protein